MPIRRLRLIARTLALALLIGQMGAQAHAWSHIGDDQQGLPDTSQGCRTCVSFAPLLSAVGGTQAAVPVQPQAAESFVLAQAIEIPDCPARRAFQSRAPPVLF